MVPTASTDKDVLWDYDREHRLTSDGRVVLGWREGGAECQE